MHPRAAWLPGVAKKAKAHSAPGHHPKLSWASRCTASTMSGRSLSKKTCDWHRLANHTTTPTTLTQLLQ